MAHQSGANVVLLLGYESAFKTIATDGFSLPFNTFGVKGSQSLNKASTIRGNRNPVEPFLGNRDVAGSIVVPIDSLAMAYWLKAMFGAPTTTGAGPYTHEYKVSAVMPSLTLETQFTDLVTDKFNQFLGCKVDSFSISVGGDGELVGNIGIVGASDSLAAASFDGTPTTVAIGRVNNFNAAILEGGGALANATEFSLNLNFDLDKSRYVIGGAGVRGSMPDGIVGVSGNIKTLFEDSTLLDKAIAKTETSLKVTVTAAATSIFELEIQELYYARNSPDVPGPTGLMVDLNFEGFYTNGAEASAIVARLTNSVVSY